MRRIGLLILAGLFAGCSALGGGSGSDQTIDVCSAVSAVQLQQTAVESGVAVVVQMHNAKQLTDAQYQQAQFAYNAWAATQGEIATALVGLNDAGGKPSAISVQTYVQLGMQAALDAARFYAIYSSMTKQATPLPAGRARAAAAASTCTVTDAQITSQLMPPTWAQLTGVSGA